MNRFRPDTPLKAAVWYLLLTIAATWPLATRLWSGVPSDLGDPLLNDWILAWNARHLLRALGGDLGALGELWHTNIFYPAPYTLGYSELLITQSLLVLPFYGLTGNIVLGYNLLFFAAFVLSGLGMFLFVRALADDWRTGFVAGALFAFAPYRFHQAPHLQVMWSCWMPFVLYGLHTYLRKDVAQAFRPARTAAHPLARLKPCATSTTEKGSWTVLAGTALALAAQNLSCGYYMLFFAPFVALYAVWEMARRRRIGQVRTWGALALTGAAAAAMTVPFMTPYLALRGLGQHPRALGEVAAFSADSFSYLTAQGGYVWGWLRTFPRAEGSLFPGAVPVALALLGLAAALTSCSHTHGTHVEQTRVRRAIVVLVAVTGAVHLLVFVGLFFGLEGKHAIGPIEIRTFSVGRPLIVATICAALLLALSARARATGACLLREPAVFVSVAAFLAFWLSLGPVPRVLGDPLEDGAIYRLLYDYVPGVSGLRVPARFAMIVVLFLSVAAAYGYRVLARRAGAWLLPAIVSAFLIESAIVPFPINGEAISTRHFNPPTVVPTAPTTLTRAIDALPHDAVLVELPFGDVSWEIQFLYHSIFHWRRMINGYSGDVPARYVRLRDALSLLPEEGGDRAWQLIRQASVTHAIVHENAFGPARSAAMRAWIESRGGRPLTRADTIWIYALPR